VKSQKISSGVAMDNDRNRVCPVELAPSLDSRIRRWLQNPNRILSPFVREGMKVLDVGCGPGFFSIEMAKLVGPTGEVVSADLQEGMLRKLEEKIRGTALEPRIKRVKCDKGTVNVTDVVDFILAFYVVHEVPDKITLFRQLKAVLNQRGQFLLVEPKLFHVSRGDFEATSRVAEIAGFRINDGPRLPFSWSAVLTHS
jgi:ubiquinone/menaquinone biosynthesis C-methylase UbiE